VIDACDQVRAKAALAAWALAEGRAAGVRGRGRRQASARSGGRRRPGRPRTTRCWPACASACAKAGGAAAGAIGVRCVFSREAVQRPLQRRLRLATSTAAELPRLWLSVTVTATFGMVAAAS
jgi:tRNA threonylcarbamoyladenosine dehydratase